MARFLYLPAAPQDDGCAAVGTRPGIGKRPVQTNERSIIIVRKHRALHVPVEAMPALPCTIAMVLSTDRSDSPDLVIDHELWLASMAAIGTSVHASGSVVFLEPRRRFLEKLRQPRRGPVAGSLEDYAARLRADPSIDDWDIIVWKRDDAIVAAATCERWYLAGGPAPYHDSYTTSVFIAEAAQDRVIDALNTEIPRAGGCVEAIVESPGDQ